MRRAADFRTASQRRAACAPCDPMNFQALTSMAPISVRPILQALLAWMDRTDRRLDELEIRARTSPGKP